MTRWIVIINGGQGRPMFMVDDDDEATLFDSWGDALQAGNNNPCADARGFDIIEWNYFEGN
jgi:hypothetical protein